MNVLVTALAWIAALFVAVVLFLAISVIVAIVLGFASDPDDADEPVSGSRLVSNSDRVSTEPDPIESYPVAPPPVMAWVHAPGLVPMPLNPITNRPMRTLE